MAIARIEMEEVALRATSRPSPQRDGLQRRAGRKLAEEKRLKIGQPRIQTSRGGGTK
jgi:hypothetical protein